MPIYDYTCARCGHLAEVIHGMHEAGPRFCPNCGAEGTMRKGFTAAAVHFKGSGWAKKDRSATSSPGKSKPKPVDEAGSGGGSGGGGEASTSTSGGPTPVTSSSSDGSD